MSDLEDRKSPKPNPKPLPKERAVIKRELEEYPVWVVDPVSLIPYAAILTNESSFKPLEGEKIEEKVLEIREGDNVHIKLRELEHQHPPVDFKCKKNSRGKVPLYAIPPVIHTLKLDYIPIHFSGVTTKPIDKIVVEHDFCVTT